MDHSHLDIARDPVTDGSLSFEGLKSSPAFELQPCDIDHFCESERYAGASSVPLSSRETGLMRAKLCLPGLSVSLVKSFPRIVRGFQLNEAALVVVPMDDVTSSRINGRSIGSSLVVLRGQSECLVHEPQGRRIAAIYLDPPRREPWSQLKEGYELLNPASDVLASLQRLVTVTFEAAANDPGFLKEPASQTLVEQSLLSTMDAAIWTSVPSPPAPAVIDGYGRIVGDMEKLIRRDLTTWHKTTELAAHVGVSVRTLQSATQAICGMSPHRYSRVLRLWSVRRQLRRGPAGRSVKSCAMGHGFWHLSEFAASYRAAFGELPSETLGRALRGD
jgi:AraC family transcriptional regulator, ethanolamine operon transcriptional activator